MNNDLPGKLDLTIYQGGTFTLNLTWKSDGTPVNLTGYTGALKIKNSAGTAVASLTSSPAAGITLGGSAGTIMVTVAATVTRTLTVGGGLTYDLLLTGGGIVYPLLAGSVQVRAGVTTF